MDTLKVTTPEPLSEDWRWSEFDLPGNIIDIFEDRDGNVWFSTLNGLVKYDGYAFRTLTTEDGLASNDIRTVTQTRDGALWVATREDGITRLGTDSVRTYTTDDGLADNQIEFRLLIPSRDDGLWAGFTTWGGGAGGLSYFDGHSWSTIQTPTDSLNVLSLTEARDGALWVATVRQGLFRYGGGEWTRFGPEDGLPGSGFVQIIQASDGSIWATALQETAIARYKNDVWTVYRTQDGLSERRHDSIWEGRDGRLWSASANGDFVTFNGERWRGVDSACKPTSFATHVEVARDGTLWVYGSRQPIAYRVRLEEAPRTRFDVGRVLRGGHRAGATWFATDDGPVRFDGRHWFLYGPEDGLLDSPYTSSVATEDGSVWFQADQGWCRYIQGRWEVHLTSEIGLDRLTSSSSAVAYRHKDGSFWVVGSRDGKAAVSRYAPALPVWKVHQPDILAERFHQTFVAANGDIWFSTNPWLWAAANQGEGAVRYDGDSWTHYTTDDGLLHNRIYGFGQSPDGKVWAGTPWGLSWFDGTKWESYGDGIPGEKPQRFQVAGEDLWCAYRPPAPTGVSRYDGATWHTYTKDDGLASNLVLHILPASDGTVWLATQGGISRFSPVTQTWSSYTQDAGIAPGDIERLWEKEGGGIGYRAQSGVAGILLPDTDTPKSAFNVAPTDVGSSGNVMLTWSARDRWDVTPPGEVRYQYRLDDEEWSSETNRTDVTLTSLSPGSHRIELRAIDDELNIEATPIVHAFVVEAPWWRNPVVAGPGLLIIAIALFQSARVVQRDKRLREGNQALSDANKELFQVNVDLQREQVLERLRGQAQGMQSSEDIGPVVEAVYRELGGLGLSLISSNITMQISENETQVWVTNEDGQAVAPFTRETQGLSRDEAALKQGGAYTHTQRVGEEMRLSIRRMIARGHPRWKGVPEDRWPGKGESYRILIEQGSTHYRYPFGGGG